jgi:hypothetical protein
MPPVRFEPKITAGERPQTYALDHAASKFYYFNYFMGDVVKMVGLTAVANVDIENVTNCTTVLLLGC